MSASFLVARLAYLASMELLASTEPSDFICWFFPIWGLLTIWISRGDNTPNFDIVTCKELRVVDKDGKLRIKAGTRADGRASVYWFDKDGELRIDVSTFADGQASVRWLDKDGETRINAGTLADGTVVLPTEDRKK